MSSLGAEEQRLSSPERLEFFLKLQQTSSLATNTSSVAEHCVFFVVYKPEFDLFYDGVVKKFKITISEANLYFRKMTVSDQVFD